MSYINRDLEKSYFVQLVVESRTLSECLTKLKRDRAIVESILANLKRMNPALADDRE